MVYMQKCLINRGDGMMKNRKNYRVFYLIIRSISKYIQTAKQWVIFEHFIAVTSSISLIITILTTQQLFDLITNVGDKDSIYGEIVLSLGIMAISIIFQQVLQGVDRHLLGHVSYKNVGKQMSELMLKLSRVPAVNFENPDFLDKLDKTKRCIEYESFGYFASNCLRIITYYGVFFIFVAVYLYTLSPTLTFIVIISFIPAFLGQFFQVESFINLEEESAPLQRRLTYYRKAIISQENFKETRVLGAYTYFKNLFMETLVLLTDKLWKVQKKVIFIKVILSLGSLIGFTITTILLFKFTLDGEISIGSFIAIFGALSLIFSMADQIVSVYVSETRENIGKIETYFEILDMPEFSGEIEKIDISEGIVANKIYFSYQNNEKNVIKNVNLSISSGETIAIVGENGAGKSTLVRLLIGLYQVNKGRVTVGEKDITKIHPASIYREISGVFQNFMKYKMSLSENVSISDSNKKIDSNKIYMSLEKSNFNKNLDLDTMLSTEFGGIDLSGGEWQRVAIARALYKDHNIIVLDEPTSAIDPLEEERIYNEFKTLSKGKTTIFVTHRLASTKFADKIIVMENGEIVEIGTYDELIQKNGIYSKMWNSQASWYNRDEESYGKNRR